MSERPPRPRTIGTRRHPRRYLRRGAKALVQSAGEVLLVQERHADGSAFWTLPGGGVEDGETLFEGLRRELAEELDCHATVGDAVGSFRYLHTSRPDTFSVYTVFDTTLDSEPTPNEREGVYDCRWVGPEALPSATLPQVERVIEVVLEGVVERRR